MGFYGKSDLLVLQSLAFMPVCPLLTMLDTKACSSPLRTLFATETGNNSSVFLSPHLFMGALCLLKMWNTCPFSPWKGNAILMSVDTRELSVQHLTQPQGGREGGLSVFLHGAK
jgi:hypothetical protein